MKLTDADALTKQIQGDLDSAPTVDAIPVDYIKWRIANADREGFKDAAGAFRFVLWGWEETKDMWPGVKC